jgi:energy-coupling factor transport system permease protein
MIWAIAAGGTAMLLRNPWYLALVVAASLLIRWRASGERLHRSVVGLLFGMMAFPAILNLFFSRAGETVLLRLPLGWLGGPYTLEALLFGLTAGVQIAALLTVMLVFGNVVRPVELLRRIPPALYPAGVAATIGMSFVTQVQKSFTGLREAQQIRGFEAKGLKDLPSITGPLLVLTLESAYGVAEGLAVRGFGNAVSTRKQARWMNAGFALLAMGLIVWAFAPSGLLLGAPLILGGGVLVWASQRSLAALQRYDWEMWDRGDTISVGVCLGVLAAIAVLAFLAPGALTYYPYPRASWPEFLWPLALAVALLSAPGWPFHDDRNPSSDLLLS